MIRCKIEFNELPWGKQLHGIICKTFKYGTRQLRLVVYSKEMPPHWCEKGHLIKLLEFADDGVASYRRYRARATPLIQSCGAAFCVSVCRSLIGMGADIGIWWSWYPNLDLLLAIQGEGDIHAF